jgi:S-DNA-T family DNA segregation ATPase FtsK/SpoIIIE
VLGILGLGAGLFLALSMMSLQVGGRLMGPVGASAASLVYGLLGLCSYVLVGLLVVASVRKLLDRSPIISLPLGFGLGLGVLSLSILAHVVAADYRVAGHGPGGIAGEHLAEVLRAMISTAGTVLLAAVGLFIAFVVATPLRMQQVLNPLGTGARSAARGVKVAGVAGARFCGDVVGAILPERAEGTDDDESDDVLELGEDERKGKEPKIIERTSAPSADLSGDTERVAETPPAPADNLDGKSRKPRKVREPAVSSDAEAQRVDTALVAAASLAIQAAPALATVPGALGANGNAAPTPSGKNATPMIVEPRFRHADKATMAAKEQQAEAERQSFIKLGDGEYQLPSIQLLKYDAGSQNTIDKNSMLELSARLTQTLENYSVKGEVVAIRPGPVVTMFEFAPAPGTRVNKIVNLTDDLALALEALRVRIVAPIPGKAAVGIEVPNKSREKVFLKEILADDLFRKSKAKLPMALGKDIEGGPSVVDLAKMPHLLVAGTTGSGKSVAVNVMITSLLYNCSPDEVRMIMVDPKMLELSIYEGVPHLLLPVVTDPRKANLALRWAVDEMDRRYDLLAQAGVRDIAAYNEKVGKSRAKWEADKLRSAADAAARALEEEVHRAVSETVEAANDEQSGATKVPDRQVVTQPGHKLPYIVVVIDEFADLMMCAPKDVETSVARIAQKARASGIHLILATQRPSVDVITGLIKANFPSRIAFHVTSKIDSRTILDQSGAEALLGAGDMLFSDRGAAPQRLHGCYVDEEEIHRVVEFLKTQGRPVYNLDILKPRDEEDAGGDPGAMPAGKGDDDLYDKAVYIVTTTRNASISGVQRRLRIGYNRAARLVEEMEKQGVVSSPDHTNKREVLINAA